MIAVAAAWLVATALPARPEGCVLDEAHALSTADVVGIEALCAALDDAGAQAAVLVTDDLRGLDPDKLANDVFNDWDLGHEDRDDGLLVVVRAAPAAQRGVWLSNGDDIDAALPIGELDRRVAKAATRLASADVAGAISAVLAGLPLTRAEAPVVAAALEPVPEDDRLALHLVLFAGAAYFGLLALFALSTGLARSFVPRSRDAAVRWLAPRGFVGNVGVVLGVAVLFAAVATQSWAALGAALALAAVEGALAYRLLRLCPRCFGTLAGACATCGYRA